MNEAELMARTLKLVDAALASPRKVVDIRDPQILRMRLDDYREALIALKRQIFLWHATGELTVNPHQSEAVKKLMRVIE